MTLKLRESDRANLGERIKSIINSRYADIFAVNEDESFSGVEFNNYCFKYNSISLKLIICDDIFCNVQHFVVGSIHKTSSFNVHLDDNFLRCRDGCKFRHKLCPPSKYSELWKIIERNTRKLDQLTIPLPDIDIFGKEKKFFYSKLRMLCGQLYDIFKEIKYSLFRVVSGNQKVQNSNLIENGKSERVAEGMIQSINILFKS